MMLQAIGRSTRPWKAACFAAVLWFASSGISAADEATTSLAEASAESVDSDATPASDAVTPTSVPLEEEESEAAETPSFAALGDVDVLWICLAAFLVFFMQAGFAAVETGFTRAKNSCNIMMKNLLDFCVGTLLFWLVGFGLMFGATQGFIGTSGFAFEGKSSFDWAFLLFQTVFCATAATIVSGAMAERTKFGSYLLYTAGITMIIYPIFGSWAWNGLYDTSDKGWLEEKGFHDFAGSTVVHSIGGWCALAGVVVLGARLGKYGKDGKVKPIPGHNIPLAAIGVFILWLGWFGFNPGSTTAIGGGNFAYIAITTNMAAATGALSGLFFSWILFKKPDPSFALNGTLAGLVAITAGCNVVTVGGAAIIGAIGGSLCVLAVLFFDKIKIDDPVGAISVHGVCGAFGTLAVGLFATPAVASNSTQIAGLFYGGGATQLIAQAWGVATAFVWAFGVSLGLFYLIKYTVGLRVSEQEEIDGLDIHEHGMLAYPPGFIADTATGSPALGLGPAYGAAPAMAMSKAMPAAETA